MGFMIAPLDLTIEELEIWKLLYSRADYNTMLVKYTKAQLLSDSSTVLKLTDKKVRNILIKFAEEGYISEIKKGTKGNPSIFFLNKDGIIKGQLKGNQRATIGQLKGNQKLDSATHSEDSGQLKGNYRAIKGQLKGNPINKIKENKEDAYTEVNEILSYYNTFDNLPKYRGLTSKRKSHIKARIDEHGIEQVKKALDIASNSDYLIKEGGKWYDFDWIFNPNNFIKILEQKYMSEPKVYKKAVGETEKIPLNIVVKKDW